jgi:hypothetical protein
MSAAEPADPTMPAATNQAEAAIIDISTRARTSRRPDKGRRTPVTTPQPGPTPGGPTPQQQHAEHIEITLNHHSLTLTDEMTATAYTVTLKLVREILQGAAAQGIIDEQQRL